MKVTKDIIGQIFGYLTVVEPTEKRYQRSVVWLCKCKCGNDKEAVGSYLRSGKIKSCGCLNKEVITKHGACKLASEEGQTQLDYCIWTGIKARCYNKNFPTYKNYGGRGVTVYGPWRKDFTLFSKYIRTLPNCPSEDMLCSRLYGKRLKVSLDRIKNNKGYEPGNLKWATRREQNNNRRNTLFVRYKGVKLPLGEAVEKYAVVSYNTTLQRIKAGWTVKDALLKPSKRR